MPSSQSSSWVEFWNHDSSIYVSERHKLLHDELVSQGIIEFIDDPATRLLDYGCGNTTSADRVAERCASLTLYDAASTVRAQLVERYAGHAGIRVVSFEELEAFPAGSVDLVIVNSVVQYLSASETGDLLARLLRLLSPRGRLVVGDVVPRQQSMIADAASLLQFAYHGKFLPAAVVGLAKTVFSDYRSLRAKLGLAFYDEAEMLALLNSSGFVAERHRPNIGHNQGRMTFVARPRG